MSINPPTRPRFAVAASTRPLRAGLIYIALAMANVLLATAPAYGDVQEQASALVDQADKDYQAHRFDLAAQEFLDAYELVHRAWLFISAADSFEMAGNIEMAVRYYRRYQQEDPEGIQNQVMSQKGKERLANLLGKLAPQPVPPPLLVPRFQVSPQHPTPSWTRPPRPGRRLRITGMTTFFAGIGTLVASHGLGIGALLAAQQIERDAIATRAWSDKLNQEFASGQVIERASCITLGVGSGVTALGMILWIAGSRAERSSRSWSVLPQMGPNRTGVALQGVF